MLRFLAWLALCASACDGGSAAVDGGPPDASPSEDGGAPIDGGGSPDASEPDAWRGVDAGTGVCGDGIRHASEACDDGNTEEGDACSADCSAARCLVPVTHASVQAAVNDGACDTVWILAGRYEENVRIARPVVLEALLLSPDEEVILDGGAADSVVHVAAFIAVALRDLVITNGRAPAGGGIYSEGALTLLRCSVRGNRAAAASGETFGGGIFAALGSLEVIGGRIADNRAEGVPAESSFGGGVATSVGGTFDGATIANNVAAAGMALGMEARGGGVYAADGPALTFTASILEGNQAEGGLPRGGGLASWADVSLLGGTSVRDNVARTDGPFPAVGGGIYAGRALTVSASEIVRNRSEVTQEAAVGGGVYADRALGASHAIVIEAGSTVAENIASATYPVRASATGGGLFIDRGGDHVISESRIERNEARSEAEGPAVDGGGDASGGGIFLDADGNLSIVSSTISGNTARADAAAGFDFAQGGALFVRDGRITMERSTVDGNQAIATDLAYGGGLSMGTGDATIVVRLCTWSGNVAEADSSYGGALYIANSGDPALEVQFSSTTIAQNEAGSGGAFYLGVTSVTMRNTIVADNVAATGPDCFTQSTAALTSNGYNILESVDDCTLSLFTRRDQTGVDPLLDALADNGGPTRTRAISSMSAAYDAGDPEGCEDETGALLAMDQRGLPREGRCDIGAFEFVP